MKTKKREYDPDGITMTILVKAPKKRSGVWRGQTTLIKRRIAELTWYDPLYRGQR